MAKFRNYRVEDYNDLCTFFIEINKLEKKHINWNWARFEWMYEHPEFDRTTMESIGLWWDVGKIVGVAIYDMYFGEAFCGVLSEYMEIYDEVLNYAYNHLKDDSGLGIAILDDDAEKIEVAERLGFKRAEQKETIMCCELDTKKEYQLNGGYSMRELNPETEAYDFSWLLWQGFDHGTDILEFERNEEIVPQKRPHLNPKLSLAVVNEQGENVAYCCLWFNEETDYAYIEPVCTIPAYRGKGLGKAVLFEAMNRVRDMGAKVAYVISEQDFYKKIGLEKDKVFTFYWKE